MTPHLDIAGEWREVAPGVWQIELPLPFSLGLVNVFLLRADDGYILIDCGMDTDACLHSLGCALEGIGVDWREIRTLLVTHMHPDHSGLIRRVRALSGAEVRMHQRDVEALHFVTDDAQFWPWQERVLEWAGVSRELTREIADAMAEIHTTFHPQLSDRTLHDGDVIPWIGGDLATVWTPGHSPGHVCFLAADQKLLFSGDHMLERISPNIGWQPDSDALGDYLSSLDRVAQLDVGLVLSSHGQPFQNHRNWIARARRHHEDRCAQVLDILTAGPRNAYEATVKMWTRPLPALHLRFAVFEALAHLEHLKRRGDVKTVGGREWPGPSEREAAVWRRC